jgi:chemotaxis protein MotA
VDLATLVGIIGAFSVVIASMVMGGSAGMFALPTADKLGLRGEEEARVKSMIIDALLAIQGGQNPRVIDSMLKAYLQESMRAEAK